MDADKTEPLISMLPELVLKGVATEVRCGGCGAIELVIPIDEDEPLDAAFVANYFCDQCEGDEE